MSTDARLLAVIPIILALGGCGGACPPGGCLTTVPIKVENSNFVFSPALRMGIDLSDGKQAAAEPHTGQAIELGIAHTSGSGSQYIAGNEQIVLNNNSIAGPQNLRNEFGLYSADLSYRWRKFPWEGQLGFELSGGLVFSSLELTVSSPTQNASASFDSSGVQGGLGLILRLNPGTSLQARVAEFTSGAKGTGSAGVNSMRRYELSYAKALGENLTLRAGYVDWSISGDGGVNSDFQLHSAGPTLVLCWDFNAWNSGDYEQSDSEPLE